MKPGRWIRHGLLTGLWVLAGLILSCEDVPGQSVRILAPVAEALNTLAQDSVEHVVCLYGRTQPDTIVIDTYALPVQQAEGTHNVVTEAVDCSAALVHWHNHPVPKDSLAQKLTYLYYSLTDEHSFTLTTGAPVAAVAVPGVWCLWTRQQVYAGYQANLTPLPPVKEQCFRVR